MSQVVAWASIVDAFLAIDASYWDALRETTSNLGPFRVRLVVPEEPTQFDQVVHDIQALLTRYRLDASIEYGIRDGAGPVPPHNDVQVLLVFILDSDTQTLCHALANREGQSHRLVACIPDGTSTQYTRRVLENEPGVRAIKLPSERLLTGGSNRVGADVMLACSDTLMATHATRSEQLLRERTYVFLLHGIRTRAPWMSAIQSALEKESIVPIPTNYGWLGIPQLLAPFHRTKKGVVSLVRDDIVATQQRREDGRFIVVAHSFGTYIFSRLLVGGISFERAILCGSILPPQYRFKNNGTVIVNDVGSNDILPILASKLSRLYGNSGSFGFHRGAFVRDRFHAGKWHSSFLNKDFAIQYWIPFIINGEVRNSGTDCKPSIYQKVMDAVPRIYTILFGAAAAAAIWFMIRYV